MTVTVNEKKNKLRELMRESQVDAYVVPTCDFHGSEYIGDYFKTREFISGFTGSAGVVVVTENEARLWTDGRYFIQAAEQLKDSQIKLMKMGEKDVPSIYEYLKNSDCKAVGFDGRSITFSMANKISDIDGINVNANLDLVGKIWDDRPKLSSNPVWIYDVKYSGESAQNKITRIRKAMDEKACDYLCLTALDEIAWSLNLRGNDIAYSPVFLSYLVLSKEETTLYIQNESLNDQAKEYLSDNNINVKGYEEVYSDLEQISDNKIWICSESCNFRLYNAAKKNNEIFDSSTPAYFYKAVKNETEISGMKKAHILDAVAVTKFIYWLKKNVSREYMDELTVAEELEGFRQKADSFIEPSFETIVGYNDHGAIVHYSATKDSAYEIKKDGIILIDSGGHYLEGTTDITRTISVGKVTDKMKKMYTLVLKGHLKLSAARFKDGCSGVSIDYLAREALWKEGLDYNHGTGHGVGCLLNVHEGPNSFRYRVLEGINKNPKLESGMITSNEPGVYLEGEFGIRIENLILCKDINENEFGKFLGFENLTYVPYDAELIEWSMLSNEEKEILNAYNKMVIEKVSEYLTEDEALWLKDYCKEM